MSAAGDADLGLAERMARIAAEIHVDGRGRGLDITTKSSATDLVTDVDRRAEAAIREMLACERPADMILGEEGGGRAIGGGRTWVVDPLDGTVNYTHGFPWYAVSVALVVDGVPQVGVVHDSARGDVFTATRGRGAFRNGQRLRVSAEGNTSSAMLATGFSYNRDRLEENLGLFGYVLPRVRAVRRPGAASLDLAWLAAGALDGFWELSLAPWDVAAGILILEEAGGRTSDEFGAPWSWTSPMLVATNGALHRPLVDLLAEARATGRRGSGG